MNEKMKFYYRDLPTPVDNVSIIELRCEENSFIYYEIFYANLDIYGKLKSRGFSKISNSNLEDAAANTIEYLGGKDNYKEEIEKVFDTLTSGTKKHVSFKFVNPEMYKAGEYSYLFSESRLPWITYDILEISKFYDSYKSFIDKVYTKTKCNKFKELVDRYKKIESFFIIEPIESEF